MIPGTFLTHDGYLSAAIFCLRQYAHVWPGCPIEFLVPVNSAPAEERLLREAPDGLAIRPLRSETPFRATFRALDEAAGDAEWVFWCSSDRYPILARPGALDAVARDIEDKAAELLPSIAAVRIVRWKDSDAIDASADPIVLGGETFNLAPKARVGFWHPQFLRRTWLRMLVDHLRDDATLDDIQQLIAEQVKSNENSEHGRVAICSKPLMKLEEPVRKGMATINYAARQARRGGNIDGLPVEGVSVAYSSQRAHQWNPYWARAGIDPDALLRDPLKGNVSVRLVSPGGVGSKQISSWLNAEKGSLAHSHTRIPPITIGAGERCLYVFGDPRNVVLSIFNRRLLRHEGHGFQAVNPVRAQPAPNFAMLHAANLQSSPGAMTEEWDLPTFLQRQFDAFRLEEHFDFWLSADASYEIVFVRYETLWKHADALGAYFGAAAKPPAFRPRTSDWTSLDEPQRSQMDAMYGSFARRLEALPDLFRVRGGTASLLDGAPLQFAQI